MLRGHRSIFTSLFPEETKNTDVLEAPERRGRSEMLILQRNELLISRYYFYAKMQGYQYQASLDIVGAELFLTERTVVDIIQKNRDLLKHINSSKPEVKVFKAKFPFMVW